MRIIEVISTIKPKTPEQQRIDSLKQQKERAANALKVEKDRQKKAKAGQKMAQARQTLSALSN